MFTLFILTWPIFGAFAAIRIFINDQKHNGARQVRLTIGEAVFLSFIGFIIGHFLFWPWLFGSTWNKILKYPAVVAFLEKRII